MGNLSVGISNSSSGPFTNVYTQLGETHLAANSPWTQIGIDVSSYLDKLYMPTLLTLDYHKQTQLTREI